MCTSRYFNLFFALLMFSADSPIQFKRVHYPLKGAFAIRINKAKSKTFKVAVLCFVNGTKTCDEPNAYTATGPIRGICQQSEDNNTFVSFLGVPYAEQPLGEWRFRELRPLKSWSSVYNATKEGPACPQNSTTYNGVLNTSYSSEACIYANIHVPLKAFIDGRNNCVKGSGLPILVFAHGGGWVAGSGGTGLFGAEYLIDENVMIITFNYRLGVLGFLSLNSSSIPGNAGLRDMYTLLKWVKSNARAFGGDPDNVTLGGQSAGGINAYLLTLSNAAKGLFKRAILMSGDGVRTFYSASPQFAKDVADNYLRYINITSTDPEEIHRKLTKKSIHDITEAASKLRMQYFSGLITTFCPVIEKRHPETVILDDDPENLVKKGRGRNIPLMIGFANNEYQINKKGAEMTNFLDALVKDPQKILPLDLAYKTDEATAIKLGERVEEKYFNGKPSIDKLVDLETKLRYQYSAMFLSKLRSNIGGARVYLYEFSYSPDFSVVQHFRNVTYCGAAHFEDLTFVFKSNGLKGVKGFSPRTSRDRQMIKQMTGYFKNFMTCSKPICDKELRSSWPPVCPNKTIIYEDIKVPREYKPRKLTSALNDTLQIFDDLYRRI